MKLKKLVLTLSACALAAICCFGLAACGAAKETTNVAWSVDVRLDTTYDDPMVYSTVYQLSVDGSNYQISVNNGIQSAWIHTRFQGFLFGTYTVEESGDNLVYTLNAATRAIYANDAGDAIVSQFEPIWYDTADQTTWPESLDGENDTTAEAIMAQVYGQFKIESGKAIKVTVDKADCTITKVEAAA